MGSFIFVNGRLKQVLGFTAMGLFINLLLGLTKIYVGFQSGFISIVGDGFNNISDIGAILLLVMTFYYASKPSDEAHPFGMGRLEYINSTVMAAIILYVGIALLKESVHKILNPEPTDFNMVIVFILGLGIALKLFLGWWYRLAAKKSSSEAFLAYSADSFSDSLSTAGVLVSTIFEYYSGIQVDGYVGVIISFAILWTGYGIMKDAVNRILGSSPSAEVYQKIKECILECPGVYGVHDLIVHDYGPENHFATAHVELDSNLSLIESHELSENVMQTLKEKLNVQAVIHADPKAVTNPKEKEYRTDVEAAIYRSGLPVTYHDFFVEEKEDTIILSFELDTTGNISYSDEEIYHIISGKLKEINPKYSCEIMIDRNFIAGRVYGINKEEELEKIQQIAQKGEEKNS